ncbi:MAG: hypothetical protein K1X47_15745 [Cyclobacteriaceae bacterium]|nr:hypothetical protein [Cyclobacteriaceae bacterium]
MKIGKFLLTGGLITLSSLVFAQQADYTFKVLATKGANEVKSGDSWQALKTGATLKEGDELKVSENCYVALMHNSGKPLEIKKSGPYTVKQLASTIQPGTSVLNKYADFILSSNSAEAKKNRLSATGAVHRGGEGIHVFLPENQLASVFNNTVIINWEASKNGGPYLVALKNPFDDELMVKETNETNVQLDMNDPKFQNESVILVEVRAKNDPSSKSEQKLIKRMSAAEHEKIKKDMAEFAGQVSDETALNKFILAGFYEQNKLLIDAITAYEQAIKLAPDVDSYKSDYEDFLIRNKLKTVKP